LVVLAFRRPTAGHHEHVLDVVPEPQQIMGDVNHDIAHANDRDVPANGKLPLAERRQMVVVIHQVLAWTTPTASSPGSPRLLVPCAPAAQITAAKPSLWRSAKVSSPFSPTLQLP